MAELKVYKLHFNSCLHISNSSSDYSISLKSISSDTMYAAITSCLAKMGEQIPDNGNLGFTISSLFPYYQKSKEGKAIYFFPKPMAAKLPALDIQNNKRIKKIRYVDADYFSQILAGKDLKENPKLTTDIQSEYLCSSSIDKDFITTKVMQRIRLKDRTMHSVAEPYYVDRVFFTDNSGLYFIVQGDTTLLDKALPLLAEEGIGTDRNVGNGYFEYTTDKMTISLPNKDSDYCVNLSVYFPESSQQLENMIQDDKIAYDIQRRGGWITTYPFQTIRKNVIYGFSEGSVLKRKTESIDTIGRIVDLRPEWNDVQLHHIWRCGRALVLPINI